MEESMKKVAMGMSIRMGLVMSFCMSLLGNLIGMKNSGKFSGVETYESKIFEADEVKKLFDSRISAELCDKYDYQFCYWIFDSHGKAGSRCLQKI